MKRTHVSFSSCDIFEFNAGKVFGVNVSACLLVIELSESNIYVETCKVYSFESPEKMKSLFGYVDGKFYSDTSNMADDFSGNCCFEWRQGVKHDCAKIMELSLQGEKLVTGLKEPVEIEEKYIFPLVKSSMFKPLVIDNFTPYKVGISGFYKKPRFSVLAAENGKPVMTDDTSYFICFPTYDMAYTAMLILNSNRVQRFLMTIAFLDAKRPFTKKVLQRIDFHKILRTIHAAELIRTEEQLGLGRYFNETMLDTFKTLPELCQESLTICVS